MSSLKDKTHKMLKVLKKDDENKGLWQSYVFGLKLCKDIIAIYKW